MKSPKCFLFMLLLSSSVLTYAQVAKKPVSKKKKKEIYELVDNVVKLNIPSLLFKTAAIQYERKISRSKTFTFGIIYRPNSATPFLPSLADDPNMIASAETRSMMRSSKYMSYMLTPEFRFYFKKKAPRGLYLAPFMRFKHEKLSANYQYYESGSSVAKTAQYNNKGNAVGLGVLFGYQLLARNRMVIDFWFLGPWAAMNFTNNSSKINTSSLDDFEKANIESIIDGYNDKLGFDKTYNWSSSGFSNSNRGLGIGLRMFGINFGYSF